MALFRSLQILFEERLGWELFRPIGLEWFHEKYWDVFPHINTAKQFLGVDEPPILLKDIHGEVLSEMERKNLHAVKAEEGIYIVRDVVFNKTHKAITLPRFKEENFDLVISSIPQHIAPFNKLIREYQPRAKHIFQVGNCWTPQPGVKNVLASTEPSAYPADINVCFYHQEFDKEFFHYEPPRFRNTVHSYIHYMKEPYLMDQIKPSLPGWQVVKYGAGMEQVLQGMDNVSAAMKASSFTWQYKPEGDGYGHGIHSSYACGRPAVVWLRHYEGKLAHRLFAPDVTCIAADGLTPAQIADKLLYFSDDSRHDQMCREARKKFEDVVDFDREFIQIKEFLRNLR
jgi:hypothetical protein